ncbi:MAG TPA: TolC family protein [Terracidiphilus sp.]|nr:TolC family protein [Terracidiphilus sp.]
MGLPAMAALAIVLPVTAHAQVSLRTVVDLAQRNSTAVRAAQADVMKARAVMSESKDVYIPAVSFSTGIPAFPEEGFTGQPPSLYSFTVQSLVLSIPQKYYIEAARSGIQAATTRMKDAQEQVALDASTAYIELDTVDRELEAAQAQGEFAAKLLEIEQQRAEAGVDSQRDLLEAQLAAANVNLAHVRLESRKATLEKQLSTLTGLPVGSIVPDPASIPEIPKVSGDDPPVTMAGVTAARLIANSKQRLAKGDEETNYIPQLSFFAQYNRNTTILNDVNTFFVKSLPANNFFSGFSINIPLFDMGHRAKGRESDADALRATVEADEAQRQNDVEITQLNANLRELDAQAEVASLKQQIAAEDLKTVETELENGNGAAGQPGAPAQVSPKAGELAHIDERQKYEDAQEAGLELDKARLGLLRALGHMQDWINEVHTK